MSNMINRNAGIIVIKLGDDFYDKKEPISTFDNNIKNVVRAQKMLVVKECSKLLYQNNYSVQAINDMHKYSIVLFNILNSSEMSQIKFILLNLRHMVSLNSKKYIKTLAITHHKIYNIETYTNLKQKYDSYSNDAHKMTKWDLKDPNIFRSQKYGETVRIFIGQK